MAPVRYEILEQDHMFSNDLKTIEEPSVLQRPAKKYSYSRYLTAVILFVSLGLNLFHYVPRNRIPKIERNYVGLQRDVPIMMIHDNRTVDDEMWADARRVADYGMVALDDGFVQKNGLLPAQRYPWDPSKSIYWLHGYHSLHCVLVFRDLIMDMRAGRPSSWSHNHMVHCLHSLREDVECNADDFPLYTGRLNAERFHKVTYPGVGDIRMCRSWDRLQEFALANTACWDSRARDRGAPLIDDYKSCPDGSKPWEGLDLS